MVVLSLDVQGVALDLRAPNPAPVDTYHPDSYAASQQFGMMVARMHVGAIAYDSLRDVPAGECAAVYRPVMIRRCAPIKTIVYDWDGARITVRPSPS